MSPSPPSGSPVGEPSSGASGVLPAGTRLAHYELRALLGEGAMGKVYAAHDTALDRPVAIKVVHTELADDPDVAARFLEEPRAAARVVHDNLTHVYFVGTTDGRPFYAMELVPGATLEQLVARDGPLPLDRAVDALVQAAKGLGAIHAAGLVHRDVKPANLLVTPDGRVKVTDFGLSKALGPASTGTELGSLVGTPDYMSPEQCRGEPVDARTDVYALGLTAYAVLAGGKPWTGAALGAVLDQQMHAPLPSVVAKRPELPPAVDVVLARLTAKDPTRRPADMAEVVALLERLRPRTILPAPVVARGAALVLDLLLLALAATGSAAVLGIAARALGVPGATTLLDGLVAAAAVVVLFPAMERRFGGSAGKLLLHLEVVTDRGGRPDFATLVLRLFARFPFWPVMLVPDAWMPGWADLVVNVGTLAAALAGFVRTFFRDGRTLSDVWTRTRVAYHVER
ncbi:MAG: protein kinase [Planctomycetota bacterium]